MPAMVAGWAQERHLAVVIFGSEAQQEAQQEDVLSRHGSSESQATHQDGRTIRSASRPTIDNAPRSLLSTSDIAGNIVRRVTLNNQNPSRIVPAMKRTSILLALIVLSALPAIAQTSEFGVLVGGSRRFVDGAPKEDGVEFDDSTFSLSNNTFELYWAMQLEPEVYIKLKGGRIQGPVAIGYNVEGKNEPCLPGQTAPANPKPCLFRKDVEGEVQHLEANVEYRFSEPFGTTGLFAGVGFYRQTADDEDSDSATNYGVNGGVNADFPISRRYGIVLEGTYHWTNSHFQSRFMTVAAGVRVSF